jgi:hypothetical protein
MQKIDILNSKEVVINGAVYRPMNGGMYYDGGEGPNLTITYQFIRRLDTKPSSSPPTHPAHKRDQVDKRLDQLEKKVAGLLHLLLNH